MRNKIKYTYNDEQEYGSVKFSNKFGSCNFNVQMLPGCCGVALLYNVGFYTHESERLMKSLGDYLKHATRFELNRAKMQVAAIEGSMLDDFCKINKWRGDEAILNAKSGNKVIVYTLNRGVKY